MNEKETKAEAFIRLAEARINKTADMLKKVGNLSDIRNYEYDKAQVSKMFAYLDKAICDARRKFTEPNKKNKTFKLLPKKEEALPEERIREMVEGVFRRYDLLPSADCLAERVSEITNIIIEDCKSNPMLWEELQDDEKSFYFTVVQTALMH